MWTLVLTIGLSPAVGQARASDDVGTLLEQEYQALLKKDPRPEVVRLAASYLGSSGSWDYRRGLNLLRESRSPAAVPLLLQRLRQPAPNHWSADEYLATLRVLTGEDMPSVRTDPDAVSKVIRDWWVPNRERITTDLSKMSAPQLERVLFHLLKAVESDGSRHGIDRMDGAVSAERVSSGLANVAGMRPPYDPPSWRETDLHPAMYRPLLRTCGYDPDGKGVQENVPIRFAAVPLLAALRNNGAAQDLDRLSGDARQPLALRWVCLLALAHSGEDVSTEKVLALLGKEKRLEGRLTGLLFFGHLGPSPRLEQALLEALDDPNQHVRTAALYSLAAHPVPAALPPLEKMLLANDRAGRTHRAVLTVVAKMGTAEAKKCLADHLERALKDDGQRLDVSMALSAFQTAVGRHWTEAGAHDAAYYRARARLAIEWWKMQ